VQGGLLLRFPFVDDYFSLSALTSHRVLLTMMILQLPTGGPKTEQHADQGPQMNGFEENCNNLDEEEECLMRRTLAAHVDYIYTQEHNP
jgi:hypothetical protein